MIDDDPRTIAVINLRFEISAKRININPARCKSVDKNLAINVVQTVQTRKYMHVGFTINVIQTAKYQKYMHI